MSIESTHDQPTVRCHGPDCDAFGHTWEFHHGKFCSNDCEDRADGDEVLRSIRLDHRRCFSCFRPLKTINPPKPDDAFDESGCGWTRTDDGAITLATYTQEVTRDAATGFQFLTPNAGKGEKQRDDHVITGTICENCGNTDHSHNEPTFTTREAIGRLVALVQSDDDADDVDPEVVHRVYHGADRREIANGVSAKIRDAEDVDPEKVHRLYEGTNDIELAVGRALS